MGRVVGHKALLVGFLAGGGLLLLYGAAMSALSGSLLAAVEQFKNLWFLMLPLASGFGIQAGLYFRLREKTRQTSSGSLVAGGVTGTAGMVACCAHHVTDVLPLLGLSVVSVFLAAYQTQILIGSLVINLLGIMLMIKQLKTNA